jgi:hypothetical protein
MMIYIIVYLGKFAFICDNTKDLKFSLVPMLCVGMQLRCSASIIGGRTSKMAFPVWRLGTRKIAFPVWRLGTRKIAFPVWRLGTRE